MADATVENRAMDERDTLQAHLDRHPFRPAWWLRNRHAQSCWGPLVRRQAPVTYERETWGTPDGDRLTVCINRGEPEKPWVLLLHGLEGTIDSFYVTSFNHAFHRRGWNVATMLFRSCDGAINDTRRIYHMGETTDLDFVVGELPERHGVASLYLAGVSLGGNVLCRWLAERGDDVPPIVRAAAAMSPPFRPDVAVDHFEKSLFGLYTRKFLRTLIPKAIEKERQFPGCIDVDAVRGCTNFRVYDTEVTARLHGFEDAMDYWLQVGCGHVLEDIRVPTMLVTSADDPFNPASTIPREAAARSPWLYPQWTARGGHVGFVGGPWPWKPRYWLDEQLVRFFTAVAGTAGAGAFDSTGA